MRRKNPSRAAEMLSDGMIPDVNTRFIMTPLNDTRWLESPRHSLRIWNDYETRHLT